MKLRPVSIVALVYIVAMVASSFLFTVRTGSPGCMTVACNIVALLTK